MKKSALLFLVSLSALTVGCKTTPTTLPQETRANIQSINSQVRIEQDKLMAVDPGSVNPTVGGNVGASLALTIITNVAIKGIAANSVNKYNDVLTDYDFRAAVERELTILLATQPNAKLKTPVLVTDGQDPADSAIRKQFDADAQLFFDVEYAIDGGMMKDDLTAKVDLHVVTKKPSLMPKDSGDKKWAEIMRSVGHYITMKGVSPKNIRSQLDLLAKKLATHIASSMHNL